MASEYARATLSSSNTLQSLIASVENIASLIQRHAAENERERRLARPVVDAMLAAGLFRMCTPRALGGFELDPLSVIRVVEEVARLDSAAGWNLQLATGVVSLFAWFPDEGVEEMWADNPDLILGGILFPPGSAAPVEGGYLVSGRWPFVSGCQYCSWFLGPAVIMDGNQPRHGTDGVPVQLLIAYRAEEAQILDTWNTVGMRGTGSHDVVARDVFVPTRRTAVLEPLTKPGTAFQGPLYHLTIWFPIATLAAPALGIARAAIDALILLGNKIPSYTQAPLRERPVIQSQVSQAEALLGSGRAYLSEALREAWEVVERGDRLTMSHKIKIQLASSFAARAAADAVDLVHAAAGANAIRLEQDFERHFRDAHVLTQHAFISTNRYESVGKLLFGLGTDWPFFAI